MISLNGMSIWYFMLFVILCFPISSHEFFYYGIICVLFLLGILHNYGRASYNRTREEKYATYMIAVWLIGVAIGILRGNPIEAIVRNMAGTVVYLLLFFIPNSVEYDHKALCKTITFASFIASVFTTVASLMYTRVGTTIWPLSNIDYNIYTQSVFSSINVLSFVLEAISIRNIIKKQKLYQKLLWSFCLFMAFYSIVIANNQGGFKLGFITILWLSVLSSLLDRQRGKAFVVFALLLTTVGIIMYDFVSAGVIREIFSNTDVGNSKRYFQFKLIFERFKLFGNGIGAGLNYYWGNRTYDSYSVEVSYLNCIDKYGILSLIQLFVIIKSLVNPIKCIWNRIGNSEELLVAIGLLGYLFVAIGNPVLFAPYNVMLHCLSLKIVSMQATIREN